MATPDALTISAAARLCRVDRRTLQRAIHAGRLHLDAQHGLSREELLTAGYLVIDTPQAAPQNTPQLVPQITPQDTPQSELFPLLERLVVALEALVAAYHSRRYIQRPMRRHLIRKGQL